MSDLLFAKPARRAGVGGIVSSRFLLVASLAVVACGRSATSGAVETSDGLAPPPHPGERPGVAVVELFTSEGCSSCPPAEEVFARLVADARANREPIFPVAFHVDYWDEIGWKDPWSSAAFTARQGDYAHAWGRTSMYTPEVIVDGQDEMVGSDDEGMRAAIARALDRPAMVGVTLAPKPLEQGEGGARVVVADVELSSVPAEARVVAALVERDLTSTVTAGENAGQTLHHTNVVRVLETLAPALHVPVRWTAPPSLRLDASSIVVWVQRTKDGRIVGAAAKDLE